MTAPDKQELLPCPFCGNEADCDREPYPNYTIFSIWCKHCVIGLSHAETGPEVDVVKVWNTRAKPKSSEVVPSIKFTTYTDGMGFSACIGEYDLDCHEGHGKTPLEAIQDLLNSHIDDLEE